MAFRKKTVEFWQRERDELPGHRPVLLYIVCPASPRDQQQRTQAYSQFQPAAGLPEGARVREGNPYTCCLLEAAEDGELATLRGRLEATLEHFRDASYKVLVVNGHGSPEGVKVGSKDEFLTGGELAELACSRHHDRHFLVVCAAAHGHKLGESFISRVAAACEGRPELRKLLAITYFTSESSPEAWQRPATAGGVHVEIKQDITDFLAKHVQPNSPYKILDTKAGRSPSCLIL